MKTLRHVLCLLGLIALTVGSASAQTGAISGTITDAATRQPMPGVNVVIAGTTIGAATDVGGRFRISDVRVGTYALTISSIGYVLLSVADVVVRSGRVTQVDKALREAVVEGGEVVVEGGAYFERRTESLTSVQSLSYEEVRRSAGAVGDVLRQAQALPGVALTNDQRNDLVVRGGTPAENLLLVDNVEVPSLNHFGAQNTSGGPVSMLNTEFLEEADFFSGGFSAQYGGRVSSVLDISLREGNRDRFATDLEMGIAGFGAIAEGPLGQSGSYMVSLRRSYLELLQGAIGLTAVPEYWNLNAKVAYDLSPSDKLSFVSLGGIDQIAFEADPDNLDDPDLENLTSEGWQTINGVSWQRLFGETGYGTLTLSDALYHYGTEAFDERLDGALTFRQDDYEGVTTARYDLTLLPASYGEMRAGLDAKLFRARYDIEQPFGSLNPYSADVERMEPVRIGDRFTTSQLGLYAEVAPRLSPRLTVNLGGRLDYFDVLGATRLAPRTSLRYRLRPDLNLNASWGQFYQSPAMIFLNAAPGNRNLDPIRADHYIAGVSFFPRDDVRVTVEGYRKVYQDYPVSLDYPVLSMANTGDDFGINGLLIPLTSAGRGRSFGAEVYVQKKLTHRLYGQVSYSYSQTEHRALDGVYRLASFDIPHTFTALGGYKLGRWELSSKFTYASGRPYTPYLMAASEAQNRAIFDLSRINAERAPAYHRLDIRVDRRFEFAGWSLLVFADVLNVYNRENVQQYVWNPKTRARAIIPQYTLLPNIGFNVKL